ncbi:MAG: hypothetical protein QXK37_04360 [Candidatus Woesearchaeota archaeon]
MEPQEMWYCGVFCIISHSIAKRRFIVIAILLGIILYAVFTFGFRTQSSGYSSELTVVDSGGGNINSSSYSSSLAASQTAIGTTFSLGYLTHLGFFHTLTTNHLPVVTLVSPDNNNVTLTNRTPTFIWSAYDLDGDPLNFTLYISNKSDMSIILYEYNTTLQNHTILQEIGLDTPYWWMVTAREQRSQVNSTIWNFSIMTYESIVLETKTITFLKMTVNDENDTTDSEPPPFVVRNAGNVQINITINSSQLFENAPLNTSYYRYKADNYSGMEGAFSWADSQTEWENMSNLPTRLLKNFNYSSGINMAEIEIYVKVPPSEPASMKTGTVWVAIE